MIHAILHQVRDPMHAAIPVFFTFRRAGRPYG
jgi:hypothetical protein